jgi:hypothetical protein
VSLWDHIPIEVLIQKKVPPYGLAPKKWREQLEQIRSLPERPADDERRAA